jgi:flagellar L-ring protein precursor FlgH
MRIKTRSAVLIMSLGILLSGIVSAENLFSDSQFQSYVADKKAYRVGDTLMLLIFENSQAKQGSDKNVDRGYGLSGGLETDGSLGGQGSLDVAVDRNSAETTGRVGNIKATVSVSVSGIDAVGNLQVEGKQRILLNGEEQLITVSGVIRPNDVASDNTVDSTRLGNALIEYNGYDGEERNWFYKSLSSIGLI